MSRINNFPEAQALQRQFDCLVKSIQTPAVVADSAFSRGLIPQAVHEEATDPAMGPRMKRNRILLRAVLSHVQEEPLSFKVFLGILRQERVYDSLAKKLESSLRDYKQDPPLPGQPQNTISQSSGKLFFTVTVVVVCFLLLFVIATFSRQGETDCTYTNPADKVNNPVGAHSQMAEDNHSGTVESDLPVLNPDLPFVGREREVEEICSYMQSEMAYVIGVHGPPAFGKSTLAIHVGYEIVKRGTSVRYVDASEAVLFENSYTMEQTHGQSSTITNMQTHASQLQPHMEHTWSDVHKLVCQDKDRLCGNLLQWARGLNRRAVLVLDNCDTILRYHKQKVFGLIKELLENSDYRYLSIILTSQTKLRFIDVKSVSYYISELSQEASVVLLKSLVSEDCNITTEEGEEIALMVGHCPLALKVIAVVLSELKSVSPLMKELTKGTVLQTISPEDLQANQRFTVVMDIAFSHLPDDLKICAKYISKFPGSFAEEAGETILDHCGQVKWVCLQSLHRRSLIQRYWLGEEYRYQLHRLIREYIANFTTGVGVNGTYNFERAYRRFYSNYFTKLLKYEVKDDATLHRYDIENHNWHTLFKLLQYPENSAEAIAYILGYRNGLLPNNVGVQSVILSLLNNKVYTSAIYQFLGESASSTLNAHLLLDLYVNNCHWRTDQSSCKCRKLCWSATTMWSLNFSQCWELVVHCHLCTFAYMWYSESPLHLMVATFIYSVLLNCLSAIVLICLLTLFYPLCVGLNLHVLFQMFKGRNFGILWIIMKLSYCSVITYVVNMIWLISFVLLLLLVYLFPPIVLGASFVDMIIHLLLLGLAFFLCTLLMRVFIWSRLEYPVYQHWHFTFM